MDVAYAVAVAEKDKANLHSEMDPMEQHLVANCYLDILPELKFDYMMPNGEVETRVNMRRLEWGEIVRRIQAIPAKQRQGRIRKGI